MQKLVVYQNNKIVSEFEYDSRIQQNQINDSLKFYLNGKLVFLKSLKSVKSFEYLSNKTIVNLIDIEDDIKLKLRNSVFEHILAQGEEHIVYEVYSDDSRVTACEILFVIGDCHYRLFESNYIKSIDTISVNYVTIDSFAVNAIRNM